MTVAFLIVVIEYLSRSRVEKESQSLFCLTVLGDHSIMVGKIQQQRRKAW